MDIFNVYFIVGYFEWDSIGMIIEVLVIVGVDMIEIGMFYSDFLVDGFII